MLVKFVNPITSEKHEINVEMSIPCVELTIAIENIIDTFPAEVQAEHGRKLASMVNNALKMNAVYNVVHADDIIVAMSKRVTYGKYTIEPGENGGYALGSATIADKEVKVFNAKENKTEKVRRPAFVTFVDCVKLAKAINAENKKNNADTFVMGGDFNADEMRKLRYFILASDNRMSEKDVENCKARAEKDSAYNAFLMGNSNEAKKARVKIFYDIFNARTGKSVPAIHHVENNVVRECTSYNSMYKVEASANEARYISALFNEWLNSELVTAKNHRAKAPETIGKKKKKKNAEKVEKPEVEALAEAMAEAMAEAVAEVEAKA
jgi:hypothetical protein